MEPVAADVSPNNDDGRPGDARAYDAEGVGVAAGDAQTRVTASVGLAESDELGTLRRWERSGAMWQVLRRSADGVDVALLTCDAGEQVGRVRSAEPDLIAWIGDRERSDEPVPSGHNEPRDQLRGT